MNLSLSPELEKRSRTRSQAVCIIQYVKLYVKL